ncbi:MAG: putative transporter substrate-binding protein [Oscillospiraceae bacterium]|jgi:basic membrane protein A|nr:putative transporter substrate-binding protein [Oscillospiraceae bacterium]
MKKRLAAGLLAGAMALSMTACGSSKSQGDANSAKNMKVAMVTDSGDITDQSFNQTTYETCKKWAEQNGAGFNYYKPERDSDEARNASVDQAVADGATVVVLPGYMFAATIVEQSKTYPDVKFIALDVGAGDICEKGVGEGYDGDPTHYNVADYYNKDNVYCCTYKEEISGYMAGYAAVKLGYKHLGFLGGMSVPAVVRFGYGYVQGADAAANELGIANDVQLEYVYGGQFYGDADITAYMDTWYGTKGVEAVFACGGGIYTSAVEAAKKTGGKVIGTDTDQAPVIGKDMTITSAMKGLKVTVEDVLTGIKDGKWSDYAGKIDKLGVVSEKPEENFVGLPIDGTQWGDGFTKDDYNNLVKKIYNKEITISDDISAMPKTAIKVNEYGSIK